MKLNFFIRKIKRRILLYRRKHSSIISKIRLRINGVEYGKEFRIIGNPFISNEGTVAIGDNVTLNSASWANPIGGLDRVYFQILYGANLKIGNNVGISNTAITCASSIEIGDNVLIGAGCRIYDMDFHPLESVFRYGETKDNSHTRKKPIIIREGAFIGGGLLFLKVVLSVEIVL